jgi:purine-binding chemotaxis protein CheW
VLPLERQRALLVFHLADQIAAVPLENVERIVPMAQLAHPPGLPSPLEGILNLAGIAVPVLRLERLLQLPVQRPGLYSMLILLKGASEGGVALLVDRVSEVLTVAESALIPVGKQHSFNGCAEAAVPVRDDIIPLLSTAQILLRKERESLAEFQALAQLRLQEWEREGEPEKP